MNNHVKVYSHKEPLNEMMTALAMVGLLPKSPENADSVAVIEGVGTFVLSFGFVLEKNLCQRFLEDCLSGKTNKDEPLTATCDSVGEFLTNTTENGVFPLRYEFDIELPEEPVFVPFEMPEGMVNGEEKAVVAFKHSTGLYNSVELEQEMKEFFNYDVKELVNHVEKGEKVHVAAYAAEYQGKPSTVIIAKDLYIAGSADERLKDLDSNRESVNVFVKEECKDLQVIGNMTQPCKNCVMIASMASIKCSGQLTLQCKNMVVKALL